MDLIDAVASDEEVDARVDMIRAHRAPRRMSVTIAEIMLAVGDLRDANRHKRNGSRRTTAPTLDEIVAILEQDSDFRFHVENVAKLRAKPESVGKRYGGPIEALIQTAWTGSKRAVDSLWERLRAAEPLPKMEFELPIEDGSRLSELREDTGDAYDFAGQREMLSGV